MADGLHIAECWKRYNSPTNALIGMTLGWSHPIMSPTYPPWCGCHGNGRCLATAHCTFSSYGRLEAERVNQFCWNLVHNRTLGPWWQSCNQILKFLKFKMADGCHVGKKWNAITRLPIDQLGCNFGGRIPSYSRNVRHVAVHGNGAAHWTLCSYERLEAECVNQFCGNLVYNSKFGQ